MKIIAKIVGFSLFGFMLIALVLYLAGVREPIQLDNTYYSFMQRVNISFNQIKFNIPDIPRIPQLSNVGGFWEIVKVCINFFNGIITVLNIVILILNKIIELLTFAIMIVKEIITFKDSVTAVAQVELKEVSYPLVLVK